MTLQFLKIKNMAACPKFKTYYLGKQDFHEALQKKQEAFIKTVQVSKCKKDHTAV